MRLKIRHNAEIAHRLSLHDGKCQQIHGHGLQIELLLLVVEGIDGMAVNSAGETLEYGMLKRQFRNYIDTTYDHHLLLNKSDPWAKGLTMEDRGGEVPGFRSLAFDADDFETLPGLVTVDGDPTVENLAKWIAEWGATTFKCDVICRIDETATNGAEVMFHWNGFGTSMVRGAL